MKEIIRLDGIHRNFVVGGETVHALRGVSFTINEGEFVTIMGNRAPESQRCSTFSDASTHPRRATTSSTERRCRK